MSDEQQHEEHDLDAIEGKALGGSFRIPADRKDIGPFVKWISISAAASMFIIATAFAWSLVK